MTYYLRIEGTNLGWFVDDSSDLSTIRGGSLTLLFTAQKLEPALKAVCGCTRVEPIIVSASIGFFEVDTPEEGATLEGRVRHWLLDDRVRKHATFSVSAIAGGDFEAARWRMIGANRWEQMQSLSQIYPAIEPRSAAKAVCQLDRVRPAIGEFPLGTANDQKQVQSDASRERRGYGRKEKQAIYHREFELPEDREYAHDFSDIGGNAAEWGPLKDKLAIFYADGNKFGRRQKDFDQAEQTAFSRNLRELQRRVIHDTFASPDSAWMNREKKRAEVLLWGGDELMFVVPAWRGWAFAQEIFHRLTQQQSGFDPPPLTWAASLIFCHQKAPIQRITRLARNLVDHLKGVRSESQHSIIYQVLESFDDIGEYPDEEYFCRQHRFLQKPASGETFQNSLILSAAQLGEFAELMPQVRLGMPRRKLIAAAQRLNNENSFPPVGERRGAPPFDCPEEWRPTWQGLEQSLGPAVYYHLAELWDYASPVLRDTRPGQNGVQA